MSGGVCLDATARSRKARILKARPVLCPGGVVTRAPTAIVRTGPKRLVKNQPEFKRRVQAFNVDLYITFKRWYPSLSPSRKDKIRRLGLVSAAS